MPFSIAICNKWPQGLNILKYYMYLYVSSGNLHMNIEHIYNQLLNPYFCWLNPHFCWLNRLNPKENHHEISPFCRKNHPTSSNSPWVSRRPQDVLLRLAPARGLQRGLRSAQLRPLAIGSGRAWGADTAGSKGCRKAKRWNSQCFIQGGAPVC